MKKFIWVVLVLLTFVVIFEACTKERITDENGKSVEVYFPRPEKIVIYKDGGTQTITKDNKLYSGIVIKMNSRVSKGISAAALAMDKKDMENLKQKETVIEFVFSKKQKTKFDSYSREYNGLIFPVTGEFSNMCFFETNADSYSGPIGPLNSSGAVLQLLK